MNFSVDIFNEWYVIIYFIFDITLNFAVILCLFCFISVYRIYNSTQNKYLTDFNLNLCDFKS